MQALKAALSVLEYAQLYRVPVANIKLNRVLYLLQVANYHYRNKALITDEPFKAYYWGPAIEAVEGEFCLCGGWAITEMRDLDLDGSHIDDLPAYLEQTVETVLKAKAWNLTQVCLREGGPWRNALGAFRGKSRPVIPEMLIWDESFNYDAIIKALTDGK